MRRAIVLAAAVVACFACRKERDPSVIVASGHVEATEVRVGSKVPGRVESLRVDEGDRVEQDTEIARIDETDLRHAGDAAQADVEAARAQLELLVTGPREEEVREAEARMQVAEAELVGAQRELARMQGLLDRGSGTEKARDDALTRRDAAVAAVDAARERWSLLRVGTRQEDIETARARLAAAEARLAGLEQQLADTKITSPTAGVVTERLVEPGELVQAGSVLVLVSDLDRPWLTVWVSEPDVSRITMGQAASVVTDDGQVRPGRVTFIADEAEFTPRNVQTREERVKLVYQVEIALPNEDGLFKPGMPAEARLPVARAGS